MSKYKIYLVLNKTNWKVYVGKTRFSVEHRFDCHCDSSRHGSKSYFHQSIRKHGKSQFLPIFIDCADTEEEINRLEKLYILYFNSYKPEIGYNGTLGGEGGTPTKETRAKLRAWQVGKKMSEEQKKKLSVARKGKYAGPNSPMWGKHISENHKAALRIAREKYKKRNHPCFKHNIDNEELKDLYGRGHSTNKIAKMLGLSQATVYRRLDEYCGVIKRRA